MFPKAVYFLSGDKMFATICCGDSPDILNFLILFSQSMLEVGLELYQCGVGSVKTSLSVTQSLIRIVQFCR